jgi:two-component system, NtrC family, nitrogen regulation sensor histidine kinase NtrY
MSEYIESKDKEEEDSRQSQRRGTPWLLGGLVLLLLSVMVMQQVLGLWEIVTPDSVHVTLLLYAFSCFNFIAFTVFSLIFVRSLLKLRRERRARQLGSRIKTRLVVNSIAVSLLPITGMAVFSFVFLNRALDKWFRRLPADVEESANKALSEDIIAQKAALLDSANTLAVVLNQEPTFDQSKDSLRRFIESIGIDALKIVSPDCNTFIISDHSKAYTNEERYLLEQHLDRAPPLTKASLTPSLDNSKYITALVNFDPNGKLMVARAYRENPLLAQISAGTAGYQQLKKKQGEARLLGLSVLGCLTLLLLFTTTWWAIHFARGIATPIKAMAEAANEVASGNLNHRVTVDAEDELAILAESFNAMTEQLAENRRRLEATTDELREKNLALEERRNYIETVLESLSTGVISFDGEDRITTINAAALAMLRLDTSPLPGTSLSELVNSEDYSILNRLLKRARRSGRATEQTELGRSNQEVATLPIALTATALRSSPGIRSGVVLVIEDLSELLSAQRTAAWSEVAQRMAHEIKNPLTPIQLSAERIFRNFTRMNDGNGSSKNGDSYSQEHVGQVIGECTNTIIREVTSLKLMVDEFSLFARLPHAQLKLANINEVVQQAVTLYTDRLDGIRLDVLLGQALPPAMLDTEQLRRVFINLIDNSLEALASIEEERRITVATGYDPSRNLLLVEVADTGHGIPRSNFAKLFQPYFSTRERGTGLGLAIVHRIITEHGGRIRAGSNHPRGAKFTIELPSIENS